MKFAIPVEDKSMENNVCMSFGRAPYFLIYDTDSKEKIFIDNSGAASQGGAGIKAAQTVVDSNAGALFTHRCGENAAEVLKSANIKIYKIAFDSKQKNIEAFAAGRLSVLDEFPTGLHGHKGN